MSTPARRRLMRDLKRIEQDAPDGVTATPHPDNLLHWHALILGPRDTPFADGTFLLSIHFDESFPTRPPLIKFVSDMFHPNVYPDGNICLDILQNRWSPTYDVGAVLTSIRSMLNDPNCASPANVQAAQLYEKDRVEYERRVQETVEKSWMQ